MGDIDDPTYFHHGLEEARSYDKCTFCTVDCHVKYVAYDPSTFSFWRIGRKHKLKCLCQEYMDRAMRQGRVVRTILVPVDMTYDEFQVMRIHHD